MIVTFFLSLYTMYMVLYCGQFVFATIVNTSEFNKPKILAYLIIFRFSFFTFHSPRSKQWILLKYDSF